MTSHGWKWKVSSCWMMTLMAIVGLSHSVRQSGSTPPKPNKPHVILMVADDLGWNDVSWHNDRVVTPHLGQLAREGVILNQSYVLPTCTPTRAALLSGRYPFTMGMQHGAIDPMDPQGISLSNKLLPKVLKKYGYSTHIIGKWHLGFCSWKYTPTKRGFDTFYGFYGGAQDYYTHARSEKKMKRKMKRGMNRKREEFLDLRNNTTPDHSKKGVYSTYMFAAATEELIRSHDPRQPMFLYLPFQSVHAPLQVPKNYTRVFSNYGDYYRRNFLGMVMAMDEMVGRVMTALKETGHYENSVIIFTTDNGGSIKLGASNYPLRGGKSNLLEGGVRGPAFIHSPLLPNSGRTSNLIFHVTDWYRTIVGLAGGSVRSPYLDSIDQWDALAGFASPPRERVVINIDTAEGKVRAALRYKDFKLSVGAVGKKLWAPYRPVLFRGKNNTLLLTDEERSMELDTEGEHLNCSEYTTDGNFSSVLSPCGEMFNSSEITDAPEVAIDLMEDLDSECCDSEISNSDFDVILSELNFSLSDHGPSNSELDSRLPDPGSENLSPSHVQSNRTDRMLNPYIAVYGKGAWNVLNGEKDQKNHQKPQKINQKKNEIKKREKKKKRKKKKKRRERNKKCKAKCRQKKKKKRKKKRPPVRKKIPNKNQGSWNIESGSTKWWRLKHHRKIEWSKTVLKTLNRYLPDKTPIRLYNITADPVESTDLSREQLEMVKYTMTYLAVQLYRYKSPIPKKRSFRGHPKYFQNVWSPGWCHAVR